jgi:hypothetical protein
MTTKEYVAEDDDDDEEEEHYKDVDDDDEEEKTVEENETDTNKEGEKKETSTWVHRKISQSKLKSKSTYDPLARNPLYARAEQSGGMWELHLLTNHFHPSVG